MGHNRLFLGFTLSALLSLVTFLHLRRWSLIWIEPKVLYTHLRDLASSSVQFWLMAVLSAVLVSTSTITAGSVLELEAAGEFNIVQRLFFFVDILSPVLDYAILVGFHRRSGVRQLAVG